MRTKLFTLALICAVALGFVSCNDEPDEVVVVNIPVKAPIPAYRLNGDTEAATNLYYAIYEQNATTPCVSGSTVFTGGKAVVNVALASGNDYDFVFFACADGVYTFDENTRTVSIEYQRDANDNATYEVTDIEKLDAYYRTETLTISKNFTANVTLRRLTAQINVGTTEADYNACVGNPTGTKYYEPTTVDMTVSGVYSK